LTLGYAPNHIQALKRLYELEIDSGNQERAKEVKKRTNKLSSPFAFYVNYSDKIEVLGYDIQRVDNEWIELSFWLKCIGEVKEDYSLWVSARPLDEKLLPPHRKELGFIGLGAKFERPTSSWQIGEIYVHRYRKMIIPGVYDIRFGFCSSSGIKLGNISTGKTVSLLSKVKIN